MHTRLVLASIAAAALLLPAVPVASFADAPSVGVRLEVIAPLPAVDSAPFVRVAAFCGTVLSSPVGVDSFLGTPRYRVGDGRYRRLVPRRDSAAIVNLIGRIVGDIHPSQLSLPLSLTTAASWGLTPGSHHCFALLIVNEQLHETVRVAE